MIQKQFVIDDDNWIKFCTTEEENKTSKFVFDDWLSSLYYLTNAMITGKLDMRIRIANGIQVVLMNEIINNEVKNKLEGENEETKNRD